jgi:hypothetical protein
MLDSPDPPRHAAFPTRYELLRDDMAGVLKVNAGTDYWK